MASIAEKAEQFRSLHERTGAFVIPNPWDVGSAALLASLGFEALATTSAGHAHSVGRADSSLCLEEKLAHCAQLVQQVPVPVTADFENAFADAPEEVKSRSDMVLQSRGGEGAARELIVFILKAQGLWDGLMERYL